MMKSYRRIESDMKLIEIMEYLVQQSEPKSGSDIGRALDMPHGTVMCHLASLLDAKWIKQTGAAYEPGLRLMGMYSAFKMGLVGHIAGKQRDLNTLEA